MSSAENAEHVSGIVLQPLWKTQKIDWTDRKNVFEKSPSQTPVDEHTFRGRHPPLFRHDNRKETAFIFQKDQSERNKNRPLNPPRYRPPYYNRKRWGNDVTRKPPTSQ
ncbi:uncharacterized protein LOC106011598 [Aplysia californica]|uniref:Uncharacterized protein LOC106011598 n=1 Tax=Aplysia californica TaxID=6500 RepID=A0ABM0ZYM5_APLCA|nr:uncharacterized protein LOC106011598 [Aplysia californica]